MNFKVILDLLTTAIVPTIWVAAGPVVTTAVTAWINSVVGKYVPRPVQVVLSGILGAVTAGLTAGAVGMDPSTATAVGLSMGLGGQTLAALKPDTMLASAPVK